MRMFMEGQEEWFEPCGEAMVVLAKLMLAGAVIAFLWRAYNFTAWQRTEGQVVDAHVTQAKNKNGEILCGAVYKIRYFVHGLPHFVPESSAYTSNDCPAWQQRVAQMEGTKSIVLYNPSSPDRGYQGGGKSIDFFLLSVVLTLLSFTFWLGGRFGIFIGKWMRQRNLKLP